MKAARSFLQSLARLPGGRAVLLLSIAALVLGPPRAAFSGVAPVIPGSDTTAPTLTVTAPLATATSVSSTSPYLVKGVAGDAKGIQRVEVVLNGQPPVLASLGSGPNTARPYSLSLALMSGPNVLEVTAYDPSGNSKTVTRSFTFSQRYMLSIGRMAPVAVDLAGTVTVTATPSTAASALSPMTANASPKSSKVLPGTPVKVTAMAKSGYVFSHWMGLPFGATNLGNAFTMMMPPVDVTGITAVFVANPFFAPPGSGNTFYGLIQPLIGLTPVNNNTVGFLTGTLTPASGLFTGKLQMGGLTKMFTAYFYGNGSCLFNVGGVKQPTLPFNGKALTLHFMAPHIQMTVGPEVLLGPPGGGPIMTESEIIFDPIIINPPGPLPELSLGAATRAIYSATNKVPGSLLNQIVPPTATEETKGVFTVSLPSKVQVLPPPMPPIPVPASTYPQGDGFATISLSNVGMVTMAGTLADGTMFTCGTGVTSANHGIFLAQLKTPGAAAAVKGGSLSGFLHFDTTNPDSDVHGMDLLWIRPAVTPLTTPAAAAAATNLYTNGWPSGIRVDAVGALYDKTATVQSSLGLANPTPGSPNALLSFADGKLTAPITKTVSIVDNVVTKVPASTAFTLTVSASMGTFSGTFTPNWATPSTTKPGFKGILIQKGASAGGFGFFLSNAKNDLDPESGGVTLDGP